MVYNIHWIVGTCSLTGTIVEVLVHCVHDDGFGGVEVGLLVIMRNVCLLVCQ